jgi:hypothetical protein
MDEIVEFKGQELTELLDRLRSLVEDDGHGSVHSIRFAVDGGLKLKVNNSTWTPPLGQVQR